MRACSKSDSIDAACDCWVSRSFCSCTRRLSRPARADCSASRALSASCSTCGLLRSRMTESAWTVAPGRRRMRSTRPSVVAGSQRVSSGTSVPTPRTCRTIDPRFTVSSSTVARSTDGAAGSIRASATETADQDHQDDGGEGALANALTSEDGGVAGDIGHGSVPVVLKAYATSPEGQPGLFHGRGPLWPGARWLALFARGTALSVPARVPVSPRKPGPGRWRRRRADGPPTGARRRTLRSSNSFALQGPVAHERVHEVVVAVLARRQ